LMFCNKNCYAFLAFLHVPPTSFLDLITIMQDRWNFALLSFLSSSVTSPVLDAVILFQNTVPTYVRHSDPSNWQTKYHELSTSRALLQKLTSTLLVKKFPAFCGARRFITVLTTARHWSLFWTRCIQSTSSNPISLRSILILSPNLNRSHPSGLFPSDFPTKIVYAFLISSMRTTWSAHLHQVVRRLMFVKLARGFPRNCLVQCNTISNIMLKFICKCYKNVLVTRAHITPFRGEGLWSTRSKGLFACLLCNVCIELPTTMSHVVAGISYTGFSSFYRVPLLREILKYQLRTPRTAGVQTAVWAYNRTRH
jgi:hypothetical protein